MTSDPAAPFFLFAAEQIIVRRVRRVKLFVFLREERHRILEEPFQEELATIYADLAKGQPPISSALLAPATVLQAYMGVSDDKAMEAWVMDRHRQLVLDCLEYVDASSASGLIFCLMST